MDYEKKLIEMGYIRFWQKLFYRRNKNGNYLVIEFDDDWNIIESYITVNRALDMFKIKNQIELDTCQIALNDLNKDLRELENE